MKIWDKLWGRNPSEKEPIEPVVEKPAVMLWETEPVHKDAVLVDEEIPSPPEPPPKRIIAEDVKVKKKRNPRKKTTIKPKKRSINKMLPEIVYEYYQCDCEDWKKHLPQIADQQNFAVDRGRKEGIDMAYDMKPFVFCPWCGWKRYRSNRGKKSTK